MKNFNLPTKVFFLAQSSTGLPHNFYEQAELHFSSVELFTSSLLLNIVYFPYLGIYQSYQLDYVDMTNTNFFLTACHFWQLIYILLQYNLEVHVFLKSWSRSSKLQARIIIKRKDYFTPYGWMGNASRHSHIVVEARVTCVTWCRIPLYLFHFLGER